LGFVQRRTEDIAYDHRSAHFRRPQRLRRGAPSGYGEIVWSNNELKSGYVMLLLDGDRLVVSTGGYIFCLDPLTGKILWNNGMSGYGVSAPTALVCAGRASVVMQAAAQ
jgi:outer membrane protein assembly factor BamB